MPPACFQMAVVSSPVFIQKMLSPETDGTIFNIYPFLYPCAVGNSDTSSHGKVVGGVVETKVSLTFIEP